MTDGRMIEIAQKPQAIKAGNWIRRDMRLVRAARVVEAVSRLGSTKSAAEELGLSVGTIYSRLQSAVSVLGMPLLERANGKLVLTAFGSSFLQLIEDDSQSAPDHSLDEPKSLGDSARARESTLQRSLASSLIGESDTAGLEERQLVDLNYSATFVERLHPTELRRFYLAWLKSRGTYSVPLGWDVLRASSDCPQVHVSRVRLTGSGRCQVEYVNKSLMDFYGLEGCPSQFDWLFPADAVEIRRSLVSACVVSRRPVYFFGSAIHSNPEKENTLFGRLLLPITDSEGETDDIDCVLFVSAPATEDCDFQRANDDLIYICPKP